MKKHSLVTISMAIMAASPAAMALVPPQVPEPNILYLFGAAAVSLVLVERWRRNRKK